MGGEGALCADHAEQTQRDGVDPFELRGWLRLVGRRLREQGPFDSSFPKAAPWRADAGLLRDCIHFAKAAAKSGEPAR